MNGQQNGSIAQTPNTLSGNNVLAKCSYLDYKWQHFGVTSIAASRARVAMALNHLLRLHQHVPEINEVLKSRASTKFDK